MCAAARKLRALTIVAVLTIAATGCALYSDVSIEPLVVSPGKLDRGSDLQAMVRKADYLRAVDSASALDNRTRKSAADLVSLGYAELAAGRFDAARFHLRQALELNPYRTTYAEAAWNLAQVEYLQNNYETSLEWAHVAEQYGLSVMDWHLEYLRALANVRTYHITGLPSDEITLRMGRPDVPRIEVRVNDATEPVTAVIDSGAVLSIISERLAATVAVRKLPVRRGTFYGLLGEPISVDFGLLDTVQLGAVTVNQVPVAIMPDEKMRFFISGKKEFKIDFLLGANFLKEFRIDLTYSKNRVTFTRLTSADRVPDANQNLFFEGFRPHVRSTVNKHGWFLFILDTGSEVTYLNERQLPSLPINRYTPRVHAATLQGLGGAKKTGAKIEDVGVGVDRWAGVFKTLPMYMAEENERAVGIIGENFLKKFDVTIDFGRMRVDLKRH